MFHPKIPGLSVIVASYQVILSRFTWFSVLPARNDRSTIELNMMTNKPSPWHLKQQISSTTHTHMSTIVVNSNITTYRIAQLPFLRLSFSKKKQYQASNKKPSHQPSHKKPNHQTEVDPTNHHLSPKQQQRPTSRPH